MDDKSLLEWLSPKQRERLRALELEAAKLAKKEERTATRETSTTTAPPKDDRQSERDYLAQQKRGRS